MTFCNIETLLKHISLHLCYVSDASNFFILQSDEVNGNLSGEAHALQVENILFKGKSEYQEVMVFEV